MVECAQRKDFKTGRIQIREGEKDDAESACLFSDSRKVSAFSPCGRGTEYFAAFLKQIGGDAGGGAEDRVV